ncbi:hypothetical protein LOK49_LG08G00794 [Camellia lanceoleosa]|uniref:Uncharacterized protein n=1 Tax=Camellia lanceoleosa TaxID=1840588 RepID=A0ACC0GMF4_9ERIC|nr:hypothetical protein LOK49_LG08G00794 [Camellia lanceoleosa]
MKMPIERSRPGLQHYKREILQASVNVHLFPSSLNPHLLRVCVGGLSFKRTNFTQGGTSFTVIMVMGQKTKNRKSPSVQQDYLIHVHEVKPWPPSQSLRTLRSALIQWEHGGRNSGSTNPVVPLLGSGVGDGKIEFNESFRLPVTLLRQMSTKSGDGDTFQKNCLELNLHEPRRDKTVRGQLLGTAIIDLAEYGVVKEIVSVSVPIHSKRIFNNAAQPFLFIKIQSVEKGRTSFSSRDNLSKEACMERNGSESASVLVNEEHAEEAEIASVTDDDVSSHSSLVVSSSAFENNGGLSPNSEKTLTPHMQTAAAKAISSGMASKASKTFRRTSSSGDQGRVNFSLELWKKAFKGACERLCPVRAGGHECGCLPVLARLIMEQCVARLDVAMLNAILRESDDEIPTDPVSDPISDAKVLPIPAGKASFGAGAQLKNVNDCDNDDDGTRKDHDTLFKSFHLLNALSDLMMLPKDMLLSQSTRKEVCRIFGPPLIKRVVNNFIPDEFCPDPIPKVVLEALDSEDPLEAEVGSITSFPCSAAPIVYLPPPVSSVAAIIGDIGSQSRMTRSRSSVLKKSYTSDDELDELDSPLTAIVETFQASPTPTKPSWISKEKGSRNAVRYQLLREVWMNSE